MVRNRQSGFLGALIAAVVLMAGCGGGGSSAPVGRITGRVKLSGVVHGGQSPVVGSQVIAYQAGSSGFGKGDRILACTTTNSNGQFSFGSAAAICPGYPGLTTSLSCPSSGSPNIYLLALGGIPGGVTGNPALLMMAALGNCNNLPSGFSVTINEVTTAASVWALSQFMNCAEGSVDGTVAGCGVNSREVGTSPTNATGLANAFAVAANLADAGAGLARNPAGGILPPTSEINTLADVLQDCVNSTGAASTACHNLFTCVVPRATPGAGNVAPCTVPVGGVVPADTLTAALDIARNPANNVAALFNLTSKTPAFTPLLAKAPNDWTVALAYRGGGINEAVFVAIDAAGNAWVSSLGDHTVTVISPSGAFPFGSGAHGLVTPGGIAIDANGKIWAVDSGNSEVIVMGPTPGTEMPAFIGGGLSNPIGIAIDGAGNAWVANHGSNAVTEINFDNGFVSPTAGCPGITNCGFTGGGLTNPLEIAIDAGGNVWLTNKGASISELSSSGVPLSPATGITGGGLNGPVAIAIDPSENVWVANAVSDSVTEISAAQAFLSGPNGYTVGGLSHPQGVAIDGSGNAWISASSIMEFNPAGQLLSGATGYTAATLGAATIAIDRSGNLWATGGPAAPNTMTEFVGVATPVLTPIAACLALHTGHSVCLP